MRKLWLFVGVGSAATLAACLAFPPGDICGYGICSDGSVGDGSKDGTIDAPPGCDLTKDPKDSPACIDDSVGVFVSPTGSDSAPGTKSMPVKSITTALTKLGPKPRIYVCEGAYTESATINVPVSVYGALKCDWSTGGAKPKFTGAKSDFVVKVDGVSGTVVLADVELLGKDGTMPGESSIALFANASTDVKLVRLKLEAGPGTKGVDGTLAAFDFSTFTPAFLKGKDATTSAGAAANSVTCPGNAMTAGGKGGDSGFPGSDGTPMLGGGQGGSGACGAGGIGKDGASAAAPLHGSGGSGGTLKANGWSSNDGTAGTNGGPGQGGGGGEGRMGGGGGGGGAGGCGGAGASGGKGGGSSIPLISNSSTLVIASTTISSKAAGSGGASVAGQSGQSPGGGAGGGALGFGCSGGLGASGGNGGAGGGGAGGISVGILYKGTKPTYGADTMIMVGTKGTGGTSPAGGASNGVDGVAQPELMAP